MNKIQNNMKDKKTTKSRPLPIRPEVLGAVSEAQQEARRQAGMFWFMHKRDQQKDWS
jgi:hypothetical protein